MMLERCPSTLFVQVFYQNRSSKSHCKAGCCILNLLKCLGVLFRASIPYHICILNNRKQMGICIWLRAFSVIEYLSLRIIAKIFIAEFTLLWTCECHCPVLLKVTPRCLWHSTKLIGILSKTCCGRKPCFLRVYKTASVFSRLNVTSHCLAKLVNSCRSWLIIPAMSVICAAHKTVSYHLQTVLSI